MDRLSPPSSPPPLSVSALIHLAHSSTMSDEDSFRTAFANALASTSALAGHLDDDSTEYMLSILLENPSDEDAREAVSSIISSVVDEDSGVCDEFFAALDAAMGDINCSNTASQADTNNESELPRLLDNAITLKSQDITSFASGLVADKDSTMDDPNKNASGSDIQQFYANMIDISNVQAKSERDRRKARQKAIREQMEEEERKRAIDDAMRMMAEEEEQANTSSMSAKEMSEITNATDNAADVRLQNFHLANRKGGGQDLLEDATLILARGRRYGLMGRNGCGKVCSISNNITSLILHCA